MPWFYCNLLVDRFSIEYCQDLISAGIKVLCVKQSLLNKWVCNLGQNKVKMNMKRGEGGGGGLIKSTLRPLIFYGMS